LPHGYPLHKYHQDATKEALPISRIGKPLLRWGDSTHSSLVAVFIYVCLSVKNIGKPCAGEPQARFDEGGLVNAGTARLFRHRQTKGTGTDKPSLKRQ